MDSQATQTSHSAGLGYLRSHSKDRRRAAGQVYTPPHIVDFVLSQAGYRPSADLVDRPVLDPACGAGAFLEQVLAVLLQRYRRKGFDASTSRGFANFLTYVEERVWGVDLDQRSCEISREVLAGVVEYLTGRRPPTRFLQSNIIAADFLLGAEIDALPPVRNRTFGSILGNPPYVSTERLGKQYKAKLRHAFASAKGRLDLYTLFIERALDILPSAGRVALITPDKFLTSHSARELRAHVLERGAVRSIATFDSHRVFQDADTVPCVTVLQKDAAQKPVSIHECVSQPEQARVQVVRRRTIPHFRSGRNEWETTAADVGRLVDKLQSGRPTLLDLTTRISAGPATGRDHLFLCAAESTTDIEQELLRPALRGRDIEPFALKDSGLRVVVPYVFNELGSPELIRLKGFPKAARYLNRHRTDLSERHCVRSWGKAWYEFHDTPSTNIVRLPKIVVPDVAASNRFAVDPGFYFPLHSVYYILAKPDVDLHFLVAVLNSPVAAFLLRLRSPKVKDGFHRNRKQFLGPLPIPRATDGEVRRIARFAAYGRNAEAEEMVLRLFELSDHEIELLRKTTSL